ncbi:MAG: hypothetical protein J5598_03045 [Clostridia bacterium]|nr:hypothetical protein [Clostridia bacterium]
MPENKNTRAILIEMDYGEQDKADITGIRIKLRDTSVVDLILGWTALTEKVVQVTNKPNEDKCLTAFLASTIKSYFEPAHAEAAEDGEEDEEDTEGVEEDPGKMTEEQ